MNSPTVVSARASTSGRDSWLASNPHARMFQTLVRREFWEHRSLWVAPLAVSVLLLACAFLTHGAFKIDASDSMEWLDPQNKVAVFALSQWGLTVPHYLVMLLVLNFYFLDCLYAERRDRSILFWKSLPVSDGATVAAKVLAGWVVVPLGTFCLALVTDVLFTAIWNLRAFVSQAPDLMVWDTMAFLETQALMFLGLIISLLWYAPFVGVLVLASALVRRNVLLWVTLIPLLGVIVERIAFGTHWIGNLIAYRTDGIWRTLHVETAILSSLHDVGQAMIVSIPGVFERVQVAPAFADIDLWLGLLFAGACFFAAARIRAYRDDA